MTDGKLERLIRELTAVRAKLDMVCSKVEALVEKLDRDHDILIKLDSRVYTLESWKRDHEKEHYNIEKKFRAIDEELDKIMEKLKEAEAFMENAKFRRWAWVTIGSAIAGGFAGAFLSKVIKIFGV